MSQLVVIEVELARGGVVAWPRGRGDVPACEPMWACGGSIMVARGSSSWSWSSWRGWRGEGVMVEREAEGRSGGHPRSIRLQ